MTTIELKDVRKDYALGKTTIHALRGISLRLSTGEFAAISGPSGCGKTTLLNIVGCIDRPSAGEIRMDDMPLQDLSDRDEAALRLHEIGFIFQSFNLIPVLTVEENVEFPAILAGTDSGSRRSYARELLDAVGLTEYLRHRPDELSGGQRQRVAIARALINKPSLIIADEPTANLDSETGDRILSLMQELNSRDGVTFLFSTHNPEILSYATRVVRLRDGLVATDEVVRPVGGTA